MASAGSARGRLGYAWRTLVANARSHPQAALLVIILLSTGIFLLASTVHRGSGEGIEATVKAVVRGVADGDADAVMEHMSPYFYQDGIDRDGLGRLLRRVLRGDPVGRLTYVIEQLQVSGTRASLQVHVDTSAMGLRRNAFRTEWRAEMERIDGVWLCRAAYPTRINNKRAAGLRTMLLMRRH